MFKEETRQFSMGQTAQSRTCSIMEKPHTGLDDCLRMLPACFRKRMSDLDQFHNISIEELNGSISLDLGVEQSSIFYQLGGGELVDCIPYLHMYCPIDGDTVVCCKKKVVLKRTYQ